MVIDLSAKLKTTNIFDDLFTSQVDRGYTPGKYKVYFCRYIGYNDEKSYNNALKSLDEELKKIPNKHLLFTSSIPVPFDQDLTTVIMNELMRMNIRNLANEDIVLVADKELNERIRKAIHEIVNIAVAKENFVNDNVLFSFITKIMIWCNQLLNTMVWDTDNTPKCVFYGQLKRHEAYFLILLSLIGFDVVYINSLEDNIMNDIDKENLYSDTIIFNTRGMIESYKVRVNKGELIPVVTTLAQKVSKEVETEIFNSNTGMFKPWQFMNGTTHSVLLNSTVDEIPLYWEEPAKLRPGFKVEGKKVFVPNFFAKINGVHKDIAEYHSLVKKLRSSKHTLFLEKPDICDQTWNKQEMYSLAFLLDNMGEVVKEELIKHPMYKLSYIKEEIQDFMIDKLNELIRTTNLFTGGINESLRLQIIATVLSIPEHVVRLIESFDYTGLIPKVVMYVNDRTDYGIEDICLLAYLNRIGFDIIVLSPCNSNNIEKAISSSYLTSHRLDEVAFDLTLKDVSIKQKKSFFERLFKQ